LDARQIYKALFTAHGPTGEPEGEWHFVGDTDCFDAQRFNIVMSDYIKSENAYVAVSRRMAAAVGTASLADTVRDYMRHGEVRISDNAFKRFIQVLPIGVARGWSRDA
jgi:hypothetical protein